ncbi:MAG TPA: hypothetical protein VGL96_03860, partial [Casimicrobiaceae bacterium]
MKVVLARKPAAAAAAVRVEARASGHTHPRHAAPVGTDADLRAARELAWAGQHAAAVERVTSALVASASAAKRLALLDIRVESLLAQGETSRARSDADAMVAQTKRGRPAALASLSLRCLSNVQRQSGEERAAVTTATAALAAAKRSRSKPEIALCLMSLAGAQTRARIDVDAALANARQAQHLFADLGDSLHRGRALHVESIAQHILGHSAESERSAAEALTLARVAGDRYGEGGALNMLYRMHTDVGVQLRGLRAALAAHEAAGHVVAQAGILNNLCLTYAPLGLHRHARRTMLHAMRIFRRTHAAGAVVNGLLVLSVLEGRLGDRVAQRRCVDEAATSNATLADRFHDPTIALCRGLIALASGDARAALPDLQMAVEGVAGRAETSYEIAFLTYLGQTRLRLGDAAGALAATTRATTLFRARERRT